MVLCFPTLRRSTNEAKRLPTVLSLVKLLGLGTPNIKRSYAKKISEQIGHGNCFVSAQGWVYAPTLWKNANAMQTQLVAWGIVNLKTLNTLIYSEISFIYFYFLLLHITIKKKV